MKILKIIIITLVIIYAGICIIVFFKQKQLIFFPIRGTENIPKDLNIKSIFFETKDGVKLHGWYLDNNSQKTVLFFHGNAGNLSHRVEQFRVFNDLKLNAFIFDYRGYGISEGKIKKESDLYLDANAAFTYLKDEENVDISDIIIWGRSLGSAIAVDFAQNKNVNAVIIESTFASMDSMAKKQFWFLPVTLLNQFHFMTDEKIGNITSKMLIIHSKDDEVIPFENGEELFKKAHEPKQFLEIKGTHNNGFQQSREQYLKTINNFL